MQKKDKNHSKAKIRFGHELRKLRILSAWSQEELAAKLGVDRSYISSLECGNRNPTLETMISIAVLFNVKLAFAEASLL